ncbi:MAG: ABC transporter permease [Lachnospiraceae bacterium]|nr:ABC transporter permease [Lachnospiraceae bacterium]
MTVFKGYMKIIKRNLGYMALYLGVFLSIMLMMYGFSSQGNTSGSVYQSTRLTIAVIDQEKSVFSKGLIQCLSRKHDVITETVDRELLAEKLYYEDLDYMLQIPEEAESQIMEGKAVMEVTKRPGDGMYRGLYADMEVDTYLNTYCTYRRIGLDEETAVEKTLYVMEQEAQVEIRNAAGHGTETALYHYYYRYLPFPLLYALCYVVSYVLNNFNRKEIERRINSSGVSVFRQGLQGILALGLLCAATYLFLMILPIGLYGRELLKDVHLGYYIMNSACMVLVAASIAYLVGNVVKDSMAVNGLTNVIALGMCFLCGTFVDLDIMSKGVKTAAQFFPVYWYENANILLYEFSTLTSEQSQEVWLGFGIQIAVSLVCMSVALIIRRKRVSED